MLFTKHRIGIVLILAILLLFGFGLPKNIEKKVAKEINKTFEVEMFSMDAVTISEELNEKLVAKLTSDNFFKLTNKDLLLGYAYINKASSKTANFDYLVILDADLKIKHSKVLIYREEYGGEIGSRRWLKQFIGKTAGDRVNHETNIDGIAGATISVRSMTNAIDDLLQTIAMLQENKVL